MGLNYRDHAREASMPIPDVPVLFIKPRTALNGPFPARIPVPKIAQDGTSDYEAELSFVISKTGKDIPEDKALDYVLGYTASNDVSARAQQFKNSQWSFSKGFSSSTYVSKLKMKWLKLFCRLRWVVPLGPSPRFFFCHKRPAFSSDQGYPQRYHGAGLQHKVGDLLR
jgi:hypothetical protein